jgi:S-adenosylmethionine:tRNA ribosyltransferase-isomerase
VIAESLAFELPARLEARRPAEARGIQRDEVRLLVSNARTGAVEHRRFLELPQLLGAGDLLVVNDSATLPAALDARRADGTTLSLHLSSRVTNTLWIVEPRGAACAAGSAFELPRGGNATLLARVHPGSERLWYARIDVPEPVVEYLYRYGRAVRYAYADGVFPIADYQTIFARVPGSAEMPSAGRPFTARTLAALRRRGVAIATLTLHAGVSSAEADEPPQAEHFAVPHATAQAVNATRRSGGRVVAIGTTVVRALESAVVDGEVIASNGWTDLIVTPARGVTAVDGILTGFHEPRASHLAMLRAFASPGVLEVAYASALAHDYLWHEFGDVHLIV